MKITVLAENTTNNPALLTEKGLSLHVDWTGGRLMMDFGFHGGILPNSRILGVDLSAVDLGVLSHGHSDHSGGIAAFREVNPTAPIYVQEHAFGSYWAKRPDGQLNYIGMDPVLREDKNIIRCSGVTELPGGALLFDNITGRELFSRANRSLLSGTGDRMVCDEFCHEQGLILPLGSGYVLLNGCAHNGILNIMTRAEELMGRLPTAVFGGFHLYDPGTEDGCDVEFVRALARRLLTCPTRYYTGHCTGLSAWEVLKREMGDTVSYISTGTTIEL